MHYSRNAFSLIEVVFTIAILGIIASVGMKIVSNLHESYATQRVAYQANQELSILVNQLANRLSHAINDTIIARVDSHSNYVALHDALVIDTDNYAILQWVSSDFDGMEAMSTSSRMPGWSGRVDGNKSKSSLIYSLASNLSLEDKIIRNLSFPSRGLASAYLYFPGDKKGYLVSKFNSSTSLLYLQEHLLSTKIEKYKLAWTSYALELIGDTLYLHYDFPAVLGASMTGSHSLMANNVSKVRIFKSNDGMNIEVCLQKQISISDHSKLCKHRHLR